MNKKNFPVYRKNLSEVLVKSYFRIVKEKIKDRGVIYVFYKIVKKIITFENLIIYPIVFFLCLLIKIIKPIFFIRFGCLQSEQIGPCAGQTELNLCEKEHGIQPKKTFDIYNIGNPLFRCNNQLIIMWKRILRVYPRSRYFWNIMRSFSFFKSHVIRTTLGERDVHGLLEISPVHLSFTKNEIIQAKKDLLKMNIKDNDKYVLMINRGQKYLSNTQTKANYDYHSHRNSSIQDYMPMAEMLAANGNSVIRVGHMVSDIMKNENKKIIEYDHDGFRTELLDIYLGANCRYVVGSDTGYLSVAAAFHRPIVWVNVSHLDQIDCYFKNWITIFKTYWLKAEKRFMSIKEIFATGVAKYNTNEEFEKKGIELINNTPQQITDAASEMEKRLDGSWQESDEDKNLQKLFWEHCKTSNTYGVIKSKIGAKFLKEIKHLL